MSFQLTALLVPIAFLAGSIIVGKLVEIFVIKWAEKITAKTKWVGDEIIVGSAKGMILFWFVLIGLYFATSYLPLDPTSDFIIQKILIIAFIFSATLVGMKAIAGFLKAYMEKSAVPSATLLANLTKLVILVVGFLIILQTLNISITPLLTTLGIGGLAVALALQDTLSNFFAGLQIIASKQVRPGDYVKLESGEEGYVTDINWRNTTIRALANNLTIIPNSKLSSTIVTNYYYPATEMSTLVQVGVSYDSNLLEVERITIEVATEVMKEITGGVPEFAPFIRYHTFGDFSINFTVILRVKEYVDRYLVTHEFIKRLHARFKKEGIVIPFPITTVYMKGYQSADKKPSHS